MHKSLFTNVGSKMINSLPASQSQGIYTFSSVRFSCESCPTLCNPMDCSTPGLPVHHQLQETTQLLSTESVMLSSISSSAVPFSSQLQSFPASKSFQMSQFFASGPKVLELQLQHQSF